MLEKLNFNDIFKISIGVNCPSFFFALFLNNIQTMFTLFDLVHSNILDIHLYLPKEAHTIMCCLLMIAHVMHGFT